eukprot:2366355-Ditylum_brightwellii.AAC.1
MGPADWCAFMVGYPVRGGAMVPLSDLVGVVEDSTEMLNSCFASPCKRWCIVGPSTIQLSMGVGKSLIFWAKSFSITFAAALEGHRVDGVCGGSVVAVLVCV